MIRYSDLGPPPASYGTFFFSPAYLKEKPEPPEAVLFRSMGMWLAPIAVLWVILLLLSVRSARLLPNTFIKEKVKRKEISRCEA
jgi:hypothetical protein